MGGFYNFWESKNKGQQVFFNDTVCPKKIKAVFFLTDIKYFVTSVYMYGRSM